MFENIPVRFYSILCATALATLPNITSAASPVCSSAAFDTDGDGWGWESHRSCIVTSDSLATSQSKTPASSTNTTSKKNRHPVCTSYKFDLDQDGWGWENDQSCIVVADVSAIDDSGVPADTTEENNNSPTQIVSKNKPSCTADAIDPDGDGWGWENNSSCLMLAAVDNNKDTDAEDHNDIPDFKSEAEVEIEVIEAKKVYANPHIVYEQDFESANDGLYQSDQLNSAWNMPFWHLGFDQGRVKIVQDPTHGQSMQVTFAAGSYGSDAGSAFLSDVQFGMELPKSYEELHLSYDVKFADNFDFVKGGKLPGLCGANSDQALTDGCNTGGGKPSGFDGWSARSMWRANGALENYTYHTGQQNFYADSLPWSASVTRGSWHRLQHRVVLNSVGAKDGILEAWLDGVKVLKKNNMEFRKTKSVGINLFYFSTFFGGSDPSWAPESDQILYFDNFTISTTRLK